MKKVNRGVGISGVRKGNPEDDENDYHILEIPRSLGGKWLHS
jgi:hypothetical protein